MTLFSRRKPPLDRPLSLPIPRWLTTIRIPASAGYDRRELFSVVLDVLRAVTGRQINPKRCATDGRQIVGLLRSLEWPPLDEGLAELLLVADAFHRCELPLFAHDIRAEGWRDGTDRSRDVGTFVVQRRWTTRFNAATDWDEAGRPSSIKPPQTAETTPIDLDAEPWRAPHEGELAHTRHAWAADEWLIEHQAELAEIQTLIRAAHRGWPELRIWLAARVSHPELLIARLQRTQTSE